MSRFISIPMALIILFVSLSIRSNPVYCNSIPNVLSAQDGTIISSPEQPGVNPSKSTIAYIDPTGNITIYDLSTRKSQKVTSDASLNNYSTAYNRLFISPDGRYLIANKGNKGVLIDINTGKEMFQGKFYPVGWLPDSKSFLAGPSGEPCKSNQTGNVNQDVHRYDLSGKKTFVKNIEVFINSRSVLSPDAKWLSAPVSRCFSGVGNNTIYSFGESKLYKAQEDVLSLDFSPDSQKVVFASGNIWGNYEAKIYVASNKFSNLIILTEENGKSLSSPEYSFDGKYLAYSASVWSEYNDFDPKIEIRVMELSSRSVTKVVNGSAFLSWASDKNEFIYGDLNSGKVYLYSVRDKRSSPLDIKICTITTGYCPLEAEWH